jgi:cyclophilin family peptidyl-prolyl cis-trans isomerase
MILASLPSSARRMAALGCAALLIAACGTSATPSGSVAPSTPPPTVAPTAPAYTLGPTPATSPDANACPTTAPAAFTGTATVTMTTNWGNIVVKVDGKLGANAAGAFIALAKCGYYNNVIFHRIIPGAVIQAGDGTNARLPNLNPAHMGEGGPGFTIKDDAVTGTYDTGTLAMANTGSADTGGSQFFIILSKAAFSTYPKTYSIFGNVTQGMDVVQRIGLIPVGGDSGTMALEVAVITSTTVTTP